VVKDTKKDAESKGAWNTAHTNVTSLMDIQEQERILQQERLRKEKEIKVNAPKSPPKPSTVWRTSTSGASTSFADILREEELSRKHGHPEVERSRPEAKETLKKSNPTVTEPTTTSSWGSPRVDTSSSLYDIQQEEAEHKKRPPSKDTKKPVTTQPSQPKKTEEDDDSGFWNYDEEEPASSPAPPQKSNQNATQKQPQNKKPQTQPANKPGAKKNIKNSK